MLSAKTNKPRWYMFAVRVVLVTFVATLLSFAVGLFLGIIGTALVGLARGVHPNMALAYRDVAFPVGAIGGLVALLSATVIEVRRYRQTRALNQIAGQMQRAN